MAITKQEAGHCFTFYTYTYGEDPAQSARQFYETREEAREDLVSFRNSLIEDEDRDQPLRDMKIVQLRTKPISRRTLVNLFNGMHGKDLGGFIRSRKIVEVVTEPQLQQHR
ncbi:hypothetical protein WH297_15650 [Ochrobactrum vermis]|uniref:Uncharacterized protein n=1 Tax=Ochrobactrum vermis TaxID=1827297 RepID=A0ABU8PFZ4_9HYPH|nr:hypothetical protein [Ochrobactrum vermis]PQZ25554.1 hypothetical protein CQZ93_15930 [Ochrobactrum vermis]